MAKKILDGEQGDEPELHGFVYQGNAYEGLTCDALEWLASTGGDASSRRQGDDQQPERRRHSQPPAKLGRHGHTSRRDTYTESESNNAFDAGNAAFLRNWPYGYSTGQAPPTSKASST